MGLDILWTGDWHLTSRGTIAGRYVVRNGISEVLRDKANAIALICDYAESNPLALIVIAGDVYNESNPDSTAIKVAVEAIQRLSDQAPVVICRGNHDGMKGSEVANALASIAGREKYGVYVSERPERFNLITQGKRVQVFSLPYPRKSHLLVDPKYRNLSPDELNRYVSEMMEEILAGFRAEIDHECVNVLVGHFNVAGGRYSAEQLVPLEDVTVRSEFLTPFDVVCLGHLHESQKYYSGTISRSGFGEEGLKPGFKVLRCKGLGAPGVWAWMEEFIELPSRRYVTIPLEAFMEHGLTGLTRDDAIRIKGRTTRVDYERFIAKLKNYDLPFVKNAVEIESDITRVGEDQSVEELSTEEAIRLWVKGKQGYDKFVELLVAKSKELEAKLEERKRETP